MPSTGGPSHITNISDSLNDRSQKIHCKYEIPMQHPTVVPNLVKMDTKRRRLS